MSAIVPPVCPILCREDLDYYREYSRLYLEYVRASRQTWGVWVASSAGVSGDGGDAEFLGGGDACAGQGVRTGGCPRMAVCGESGEGAGSPGEGVRCGDVGEFREARLCSVAEAGEPNSRSSGVVGRGGVGTQLGPNGGVSVGRGPNYERNAENRRKKKLSRQNSRIERGNATSENNRRDGTLEGRQTVFSKCSEEVQKELADTRARRYILENKAAIARLEAMDHEKAAQKQAKKLDTDIKFLDGQLNGDYSLCPPGRVMGWAKTLVSKSSGSKSSSDKSSPSLSKGSTSPSSSVSQNERRLEKLCKELEQKLEVSEKEKEKYKSQFKVFQNMTRPVMTDQDRYFGRDHDFESGNDDDYYY